MLRLIAGISIEFEVDGHRADLVMMRESPALAALDGRVDVTSDDVRHAAELALPSPTSELTTVCICHILH
jgi:Mg-chelatase subunit ChlI